MAARYSSTLRAEQAAQTRQRVLEAAAERFAADGFARTTLARLAETAGVSVETVQAQGSKRSLLSAAVHWRTFGLSDDNLFFSATETRDVLDSPSPAEFCRRGAVLVASFNDRTFRIWRAFASAAADDAAVDEEFDKLSRFIHGQCREVVGFLESKSWLRSDVTPDQLGDSLWLLVGSENYDKLTVRLQLAPEAYEAWLCPIARRSPVPAASALGGRRLTPALPVCKPPGTRARSGRSDSGLCGKAHAREPVSALTSRIVREGVRAPADQPGPDKPGPSPGPGTVGRGRPAPPSPASPPTRAAFSRIAADPSRLLPLGRRPAPPSPALPPTRAAFSRTAADPRRQTLLPLRVLAPRAKGAKSSNGSKDRGRCGGRGCAGRPCASARTSDHLQGCAGRRTRGSLFRRSHRGLCGKTYELGRPAGTRPEPAIRCRLARPSATCGEETRHLGPSPRPGTSRWRPTLRLPSLPDGGRPTFAARLCSLYASLLPVQREQSRPRGAKIEGAAAAGVVRETLRLGPNQRSFAGLCGKSYAREPVSAFTSRVVREDVREGGSACPWRELEVAMAAHLRVQLAAIGAAARRRRSDTGDRRRRRSVRAGSSAAGFRDCRSAGRTETRRRSPPRPSPGHRRPGR